MSAGTAEPVKTNWPNSPLWSTSKRIVSHSFGAICHSSISLGVFPLNSCFGFVSEIVIFWALLLFVGIPLPGTGAWTGTLAASFLNLDFKTSITAIMLGVILAGIIMSLGSKIVAALGWAGLIAIIAVIVVLVAISILLGKKKR